MANDKLINNKSAEREVESDRLYVQLLLRIGLVAATLFMVAGAIVNIVTHNTGADAIRLTELFHAHLLWGDRLMGLGILFLAATPAFRVVALLFLWSRERDWKFATVAAVVMVTLILAIFAGGG